MQRSTVNELTASGAEFRDVIASPGELALFEGTYLNENSSGQMTRLLMGDAKTEIWGV